jgi:hypothetical protein
MTNQWMLLGDQVEEVEEQHPQQQSHLPGVSRVTPSHLSRSHKV